MVTIETITGGLTRKILEAGMGTFSSLCNLQYRDELKVTLFLSSFLFFKFNLSYRQYLSFLG